MLYVVRICFKVLDTLPQGNKTRFFFVVMVVLNFEKMKE